MIVISSIIPRPKDHSSHGDRVKNVNKGLVQMSQDRKVRLLHTYRPDSVPRFSSLSDGTIN